MRALEKKTKDRTTLLNPISASLKKKTNGIVKPYYY